MQDYLKEILGQNVAYAIKEVHAHVWRADTVGEDFHYL